MIKKGKKMKNIFLDENEIDDAKDDVRGSVSGLEFSNPDVQEKVERSAQKMLNAIKTERDKRSALSVMNDIEKHSSGSGKISYVDVSIAIVGVVSGFGLILPALIKYIIGGCRGNRKEFNANMKRLKQAIEDKKVKN